MQVRTLGDLVIYLGAVAGALGSIGLLLRYLVVGPLKRWIVEQTQPAREAAAQLRPNGGGSARDLIQVAVREVADMKARLDEQMTYARETREMAAEAITIARETSDRLDKHLAMGHGRVND